MHVYLQPNKFFLSRNTAPHIGDRIQFGTYINRSLPVPEAIELVAALTVLIDDDQAVGDEVRKLRGIPLEPAIPAIPMQLVPPATAPAVEIEQFDDHPAGDAETRAEEAADEVADAIEEAKPEHHKVASHRKRA